MLSEEENSMLFFKIVVVLSELDSSTRICLELKYIYVKLKCICIQNRVTSVKVFDLEGTPARKYQIFTAVGGLQKFILHIELSETYRSEINRLLVQ